ncbi:MAG: hypothetical protein SOI26_04800 [Coriobacteriales bacterium]|jgi:hypothetical protein
MAGIDRVDARGQGDAARAAAMGAVPASDAAPASGTCEPQAPQACERAEASGAAESVPAAARPDPASQPAPADPAARPAPAAQPAPADAESDSFERRVRKLELAVARHPLHREINVEILRFCRERRDLADVEDHVQRMPEFAAATLDPYHLIDNLVRAGGLERFNLDAEGEIVTDDQLRGLSEDAADDLVAGYALQTTDEGEQAIADASPEVRVRDLLEREPERRDTYAELLAFFEEEPRSYRSVCDLLQGRDVLFRVMADGSRQKIQPSVFVDRLERAGAIVWDEGWTLTEEGRRALGRLAG